VGSVGDLDAAVRVEALGVSSLELIEEGRNVSDDAGADDVGALRVDESYGDGRLALEISRLDWIGRGVADRQGSSLTRWQKVKVVGDAIGNNSMAGVGAASTASADIGIAAEHIDKLSLAFVSELSTENNGSHGGDGGFQWP